MWLKILIALFLPAVLLLPASGTAADKTPCAPGPEVKCPVCGMFVAKYPDWIAEIHYKDGESVYFDGAKDLFKYLQRMERYAPDRTRENIKAIWFTEYYDMKPIKAEDAVFVLGSEVYGPMGKELIPVSCKEAALTFMADHGGDKIVTFEQVDPALIKTLD